MYYYRHHIGDFKRDTEMLSNDQSMVYLRLLWMYYDSEEPLPDDPGSLAFYTRSDIETVSLILKHFFSYDDGVWRHSRCDREINAYQAKRESAKRSADKRWQNAKSMPTHSDRNANAYDHDANAPIFDANQEPITKNQEPATKNQEKRSVATAKRFAPPTVEQVKAYCVERKNRVDARRFVDFYEAKGWLIGKNKMKDWKAAVRTWEGKDDTVAGISRRPL